MPATALNVRHLTEHGPVIPVIVIDRVEDAVPLAQALVAGGVKVLEVTLRTPAGLPAISEIAREVPDAIVGAGTVRSVAELRAARDAGATFAVSPGFLPEIGQASRDMGLLLLPGVATASEVMAAQAQGFDFLKLFPAVPVGGLALLKALAGPFPDVAFCPTGGLTPENAGDFLALPNVLVCGGSWLTPAQLMARRDWPAITELARQTAALRR